jgi:hypothetical protein
MRWPMEPADNQQPQGRTYYTEEEVERRARQRSMELSDQRIEQMLKQTDEAPHWTVDKRVPLALILALVFQTMLIVAVGASWKQATESRLAYLEQAEIDRKGQEPRLIRLEEKVMIIGDTVERIDQRMTKGNAAP